MPTTQTQPVPSAARLARWLEGYRILASGQSLDAEEAHHAWVLQEVTPRTLYVSDVAAVLAAFTELTEAVAAVELMADDSALFERADRALAAAQQLLADTPLPAPIPLDDVRRLKDDPRAIDPAKHHHEPCLLCGSPLTHAAAEAGAWVNLATSGRLVPAGYVFSADEQDQGWFPVGSDCARRLPAEFKQRGVA